MPKFCNGACLYAGSTPINHIRLRYRNDGSRCLTLYNGWYIEQRNRTVQGALWQQYTTQKFVTAGAAQRFAEQSFGSEGHLVHIPAFETFTVSG